MAYDEELADRVRELIATEPTVSERAMFGGLAFMFGGNMGVAVGGQGGLMIRGGVATDRLLTSDGVATVEMRGRPMTGWLRVDAEAVRTKRQLTRWVGHGVTAARSLPPK